LDAENQEAFYRGNVNRADVLRGVPACLPGYEFYIKFKKKYNVALKLYFPEEEMDKVLCCAKNRSDFRVSSASIS